MMNLNLESQSFHNVTPHEKKIPKMVFINMPNKQQMNNKWIAELFKTKELNG